MRKILRTIVVALALVAVPPLFASASQAAPAPIDAPAFGGQAPAVQGPALRAADAQAALGAATNTPPPPTDPASTGPANPGTGETGEAEATRLDFAPLVIGAVAVITLVVILIWRRRRNSTIV